VLLLANYTNESKFKTQSSSTHRRVHEVNNKPRFKSKRDRKKEKKSAKRTG